MDNGWEQSAQAWITSLGTNGDWARQNVLDPAMLDRVAKLELGHALDVGCGEGRFCRVLQERGFTTAGIDPTEVLLQHARQLDPPGDYRPDVAEALSFQDASFDLVVSYLSLIDIPDFRSAIKEMTRVLRPGGVLLLANLTSFYSAGVQQGWMRTVLGNRKHYALDNYLEESSSWEKWKSIRVKNWHRPLSAYMQAFLDNGLQLTHFDEPEPISGDPARQAYYRRAPWFVVMEWRKPG